MISDTIRSIDEKRKQAPKAFEEASAYFKSVVDAYLELRKAALAGIALVEDVKEWSAQVTMNGWSSEDDQMALSVLDRKLAEYEKMIE